MNFTEKRSMLLLMNELNNAPSLPDEQLRPLILSAAEEVAVFGPIEEMPFCCDLRDTVDTDERPDLIKSAQRLLITMLGMTRD
jgi:hypothetical protein